MGWRISNGDRETSGMHFDAFFDSCTSKNPIKSKQDDNFDNFFENCVLGKRKEPVRKRHKPVHTRLSYREDQNTKTSASSIEHELSSFKNCCQQKCFTWFTVQLVVFCRSQYILLPSYEARRTWLHKQVQKMKKYAHGYVSFVVDALGQEYKSVCGEAWRLAYGVPRNTYMRQLSPNTIGKKIHTLVKENTPCCHKIRQESGFT